MESFVLWRTTPECFAPWRALPRGELCTMGCVAPMESSAPQRPLQEPLAPAPLHRHSQPQFAQGPVPTSQCHCLSPRPARTPKFPHLGLARPPAVPLRGEEGSAMAGVFRRTINLPASHASQLQPGSDLYASEVHQREKYFPGTAYPPSPLSSSPARAARIQSLAENPRPHPSPPRVTPCPHHPAQALPFSPASVSKRKLPLPSSPP